MRLLQTSLHENLSTFQKGAGFITFALFQAASHVLDGVGMAIGDQDEVLFWPCLSILTFL